MRAPSVALVLGLVASMAQAQVFGFDGDPVPPDSTATPVLSNQSWGPDRTWVFAVGVLEWQDSDSFSPFPKEGRKDSEFIDLLRSRGVSQDRVVYLQDSEATISRVQREFSGLLSRTRPGDFLIVFFTGHGYRDEAGNTFFATHDAQGDDPGGTAWRVSSILDDIQSSYQGAQVFLTADCCYSGSLAIEIEARGGAPSTISYAALTSSLSNVTSTDAWTFTACLVAGFSGNGRIDRDGDGAVRLDELAGYARNQLAFLDDQFSAFTTTYGFDPEIRLATASPIENRDINRHMEARYEGKWYRVQVVDLRADGDWKVHYVGWPAIHDEWFSPTSERLREPVIVNYPIGTTVEVKWHDRWWPAEVQTSELGLHEISYRDYGSEWDEWVGADRIRLSR